jgi:glycerol-3-phosphate acyltransferase PlsY
MMTGLIPACCGIAFLIGGIPFGYLAGQLVLKDDIRRHGSGNIGATNVARVLGWKWGSLVLFLDALKGLLPTLGAKLLLQSHLDESTLMLAQLATGISAIAGHMFPVWLKLRGGKGVATALGVVLVISPIASAAALLAFVIILAASRIVALSSIVAVITYGVTQITLMGPTALSLAQLPLTLFSVIAPGLIVWRHRSNILRMLKGEERRLGSKQPESSAPEDSTKAPAVDSVTGENASA